MNRITRLITERRFGTIAADLVDRLSGSDRKNCLELLDLGLSPRILEIVFRQPEDLKDHLVSKYIRDPHPMAYRDVAITPITQKNRIRKMMEEVEQRIERATGEDERDHLRHHLAELEPSYQLACDACEIARALSIEIDTVVQEEAAQRAN